jgi:preprotein translocase subunit SecF
VGKEGPFDIITNRKWWYILSLTIIGIGLASMVFNFMVRGRILNFGIDFTGGTVMTIRMGETAQTSDIQKVRTVLSKYKLSESGIQKVGDSDLTMRTEPISEPDRKSILDEIKTQYPKMELLEVDTIGPVIGKELRTQALMAVILASVLIVIYVSFRFEFRYALAALIALYHDALITTGVVAILWINVDSTFVAAILTILGYSINDTIVIYDRVRENLALAKGKKIPFEEVLNHSVWQTMARSINTVMTVLFMNATLLLFGGATIKDFAAVLLIGFSTGAYSSIFVAPPLLAGWAKGRAAAKAASAASSKKK